MAIDLDVHGNTKPLEAAVQAAINRIRRQPIKITVDDKGATQPLGNMKRAADEFSKSMEAANARILAFGASMAIINGVADAFKGMVRNMVEVEKSMADINVVMGLSAQNLDKFGDGLFKVAKETGAAFKVAADAATEYARQGLSMEESLKRTRDALILTRLTGMDSAEAVKSLTAAMNTYGNQIKDTTQLVSKFAAVDVQFAVSAEDFAAAISRTGQAAKSAGVNIDELIGIVTSAQQQTARGGAVIGNALKTIFTKTGRTDTLNQLEDLGIAVRDLEGNTIGAKRILTELANTFDHLSESQKAQITQTMGGLFHINILKAVLSDAAKQNGILARATQISSSATDEAIQKNEQLRQTMSAMATETGLAIKQVSTQIGELMLAPGMEKILNTVKSLAEGLSGVLGDGEGMGNKFATGLLKGIGNVITGPGLVVLTAVFFKLFGQAAKFTRESLSSLIGISSEAQKQKAIQSSLVALIGQNAALGKEMLRTDITRTEKEKILLGLLKAQNVEAERLNAVSQKLAATLYTRGYGPGLTQGKRRAYGHIPNFADPERSQAARGGYAAGSIRTMNMPGEGSVIYNSAETVKNFAGFKQPAIMPPQSSKAGKNYKEAFGNIHGFDPYAAGGYIPNFARGGKGVGAKPRIDLSNPAIMAEIDKKTRYLNADSNKYIGLSASLGPDKPKQTFYVAGGSGTDSGIFNQKGRSFYKKAAMQRAQPRKIDVEFKSLDEKDERRGFERYDDEINSKLQKRSAIIASGMLKTFGYGSMNSAAIEKDLPKSKMSTVAGHIFEAVTKSVLRAVGAEASIPDAPTELIDLKYNKELYELFGVPTGKGSSGAEAKINTNLKNVMSFARKIYSSDPTTKTPLDLKSLPAKKGKAYGHIPNFADPLSDAIGREKAAGVPVSQIRVGSHNALMSKGNPLGLGVTNTRDEPNGLRDVFGANGFVPNYAFNPFGLFSPDEQTEDKISSLNRKIERQEKAVDDHTKSLKNLKVGTDKYNRTQQLLNQTTVNLQKTRTQVSSLERRSFTSSMKKMGGVMNSGIGMAGIGMLSGFVDDPAIGSAMSYASTGGYIGHMLAPVLGPLAPFGTLIGAAAGGLYGFVDGLEQADKAARDKAEADKSAAEAATRAKDMVFAAGLAKAFQGKGPSSSIGSLNTKVNQQTFASRLISGSTIQSTGLPSGATYLDTFDYVKNIENAVIKNYEEQIQGRQQAIIQSSDYDQSGTQSIQGAFEIEESRAAIAALESSKKTAGFDVRKEILKSMFDEEAKTKSFSDPEFANIFGKTEVSGGRILAELESWGPDDPGRLNALWDTLYKGLQEKANAENEYTQAVIKQFDLQLVSLRAQDDFNKEMHKTNESFRNISNMYKFREQTLGRFMSQSQKNELDLNKAMNEAQKTYAQSMDKNKYESKQSLIKSLKPFQQTLNKLNLNETQVAEMSNEQIISLYKTLELEGESGRAINKIISATVQELKNKNDEAQRSLGIAEDEAILQKAIADEILRQRTGPKAFQYGFAAEQTKMRDNAAELDHQLGGIVATNFRDGLVSGMRAAINQAEDLGDVLQNVAMNFLQAIQNAYLTAAANQIVGAIPMPGIPKTAYRGGAIRNYSRGGGVPAMVTNGEYVMGREAVNKYGGSFMHGLNAGGKIPGFSNGGSTGSALAANFGGGRGFKSGRAYQGRAMSGFFYSQSGNVGLGEDRESLLGILAEEERQRQAAAAKKAKKKALWKQLLGTVVSAGISYGIGSFMKTPGGGVSSGLSGSSASGPVSGLNADVAKLGFDPFSDSTSFVNSGIKTYDFTKPLAGQFRGGPIRKYASGGYISGKSGIDQIPAMLSEGEYVIRASSARQLGKPMLDRINAGKFNEGGAVSELMGNSETASSGGNTNNINISINMERGSGSKKENQSQDNSGQNPADRSSDEQNSAALADRIKQQVVAVIVEEQRPGGLLSE